MDTDGHVAKSPDKRDAARYTGRMIKISRLIPRVLAAASNGKVQFGRNASVQIGAVVKSVRGGAIRVGDDSSIHAGAKILTYGGDISIGRSCSVNPYCVLYGHGGLTIGDDVRIATHVVIVPSNHEFSDLSRPIRKQGISTKGIVIEDNVWIAAHATILDGAHIRRGCVIGAGSVVRGETVENGVYAGVPARLIKIRGSSSEKPLSTHG